MTKNESFLEYFMRILNFV